MQKGSSSRMCYHCPLSRSSEVEESFRQGDKIHSTHRASNIGKQQIAVQEAVYLEKSFLRELVTISFEAVTLLE